MKRCSVMLLSRHAERADKPNLLTVLICNNNSTAVHNVANDF